MAVTQFWDSDVITLPAGANLTARTRVKLNTSGQVVAASVTEPSVGYVDERGGVSGQPCTVRLNGKPRVGIAAGQIEVGDKLWAAASGKVNDVDAGSGIHVGTALTAAGADNEEVVFLPPDYVS